MIKVNEDKSIYVTRGDVAPIKFTAKNRDGEAYIFAVGDVVRLTVYKKNNCSSIVLVKDTAVTEESSTVTIDLNSEDTRIGDPISKPTDYWYDIELNPDTYCQTLIGYDDESGAKIFKLFPEGSAI